MSCGVFVTARYVTSPTTHTHESLSDETARRIGSGFAFGGNSQAPRTFRSLRCDDACHLTHDTPSEFLTSHRESTAPGVGQSKRLMATLLPEDPILLPEIVDQIVLVAVHPASDGEHEELQSMGHCLRLLGDTASTDLTSAIRLSSAAFRSILGC